MIQTHDQVFLQTTYSGKISANHRQEKYILIKIDMKRVHFQSEKALPKGNDHFEQKNLQRAPLNLQKFTD
ncbi:MAG: hypothetical protein ACM3N1_00265 [Accumulibacter sp.]